MRYRVFVFSTIREDRSGTYFLEFFEIRSTLRDDDRQRRCI